VPVPGCPLRLGDSPVGPLRAAPALGQSTEQVLAELSGEETQHVVHA
jgi:Predicted acyl-CoA transferases/carnitine dehydratase